MTPISTRTHSSLRMPRVVLVLIDDCYQIERQWIDERGAATDFDILRREACVLQLRLTATLADRGLTKSWSDELRCSSLTLALDVYYLFRGLRERIGLFSTGMRIIIIITLCPFLHCFDDFTMILDLFEQAFELCNLITSQERISFLFLVYAFDFQSFQVIQCGHNPVVMWWDFL